MQECSLWGFECAAQYKLRPTSVNVDAARGLAEAILKFVAISDPKRSVIEKQHDWLIKAVLATGRPLASTERNGFCFEELKEVFNKILLTRSVEDFSQLAPSKKRSLF